MMFQMIGVAWYLDFESSGITIVSWLYRLKLKIVSELFNRMEHMVLFVCFTWPRIKLKLEMYAKKKNTNARF